MTFAIILVVTIIACAALRNPIRKWPMVFYALAVVASLVFVAGSLFDMPRNAWIAFWLLIQKCTLSLAIFIVVMFIGVFSHKSKVYLWFKPIRAELSILAWILSLGHMVIYLVAYVPRFLGGTAFSINVVTSFVLAIVLFVLLMVLGITSFHVVKKHMSAETWIKVQKLAYVFFGLVYVHLVLMLLPAAMRGGYQSIITVGVYTCIFFAYAVLRVRRSLCDRKANFSSEMTGEVLAEHDAQK